MSTFCVRTGKKITFSVPDLDNVKCYPKAWFEKNVGQKPAIPILIRYNSLETLRPNIRAQLNNQKLDLDLVKEYIYLWGKTVTAVCHEDWQSFGTIIARAGEEVHPWNVLEVKINYGDPEVRSAATAANADDFEIIVILIGLYRVLREKNETQVTQVVRKIQEQTRARGASSTLLSLAPHCRPLISNKDYTKMIAALDMFFVKFKDHKYSTLRAGTFMSRHRDCAALTLIGDITQLLGINKAGLCDWIFCKSIADEINILTAPEQETEVQDSYFPYQIDMALVYRSAYSTACNPCFYFFAHAVGALLGSERSINARMFLEKDIVCVRQNAQIAAFVFAQIQGNTSRQASGQPSLNGDQGNSERNTEDEGTPKTRDAKEWFVFMHKRRWRPTHAMIRFIEAAKTRIVNPKNKTIGEEIKKGFLDYIFV